MIDFFYEEKQNKWYKSWEPIIERRKLCVNPKDSLLLQLLNSKSEEKNWRVLKNLTEYALSNATNAEKIFSNRVSQMKFDDNSKPDEIIEETLSELVAICLLKMLGFEKICHFREDSVDFKAILKKEEFYIEVSFINGPNFKTQENIGNNFYKLLFEKLENKFKNKYESKIKQILKRSDKDQGIIILITNLEETYSPWLQCLSKNEKHPIQLFVDSCEIPTIVFGQGLTVYISEKLKSKCNHFDRYKYVEQVYGISKEKIDKEEKMRTQLEEMFWKGYNLESEKVS